MRRCAMLCGFLLLCAACDQRPLPVQPTPLPQYPPAPIQGDCFTVVRGGVAILKCDEAFLTFSGPLTFDLRADGTTWQLTGSGKNVGTRCASQVRGLTEFRAGTTFEVPWQLEPTVTIRPGAAFTYPVCCPTVASLEDGGSYQTVFTYESVPCS